MNMTIGATEKNPGVRMAFYKNANSEPVELLIGEAPGQPVNVYRAGPGGVILGPFNYVEAFARGGLTQISDEEGRELQSRQNKVLQAVSSMSSEQIDKLISSAPASDPEGGVTIKKAK